MSTKFDIFADKEYDDMEWLNKALEPFIFPLNDVLATIPDRFDFTAEDIKDLVIHECRIEDNLLFDIMLKKLGITLAQDDRSLVISLLKFSEEKLIINLSTMEMIGELYITKTKSILNEEDIKEQLGNIAYMKLGSLNSGAANMARLNELIDIVGVTEARNSRSTWSKISALQSAVKSIIVEDKWRIRSAPLIMNAVDWMVDFVDNGNLAALSNVTRLKCMTYAKKPIYSMQETI